MTRTQHFKCGCIGQCKDSGSLNWIYCGSRDCPYDELGEHLKFKNTNQKEGSCHV